ncbi:putative regulatory protein [Candidatus Erwinia dacicola]|nr:putative regulatory protein [Candidatus Erwinia dacicola]
MHGRNIKQCADDWDIKLSTLKNYFSRLEARPRYEVLSKISNKEKVSIEWLLNGVGSNEPSSQQKNTPNAKILWLNRLTEMLELLSDEDVEALTRQLTLKGVETILYLLDDDNIKLLRLDRVMKEKVLGLQPRTPEEVARDDEEARECGPDTEGETLPQSLASNSKRAG